MGVFQERYKQLNDAQKQAVDSIDGPLLVIAGPGTGKTELLSLRTANILQQTDATAGNILCLTFTDNAARNMRERLEGIIGADAHHVAIHTFHSFGSEIINQYPEFFSLRSMLQSVDELGNYELLHSIFSDLPHSNPLSTKVGEDFIFLKSTQAIIGWLKQNAITPDELSEILKANINFIDQAIDHVNQVFVVTPSAKQLPAYIGLIDKLKPLIGESLYNFVDYGQLCLSELQQAIDETDPSGRYAKPVTAWRNAWLEKTGQGRYRFKDAGSSLKKLRAVIKIYQQLRDQMAQRGLYDFDDMIVEVVHAIENNQELKLNLQERYQYILIDEFQDTNKAQLRIAKALGDNPINEGRPNIMAVGDDDQAIYAFQGAESSNMLDFINSYRDVSLVTLTENYRSSKTILDSSREVALQASNRLEGSLANIDKTLNANSKTNIDIVSHQVMPSELQQYQWVAEQISQHLKTGTKPGQIAVLAPRHKYLERLMPYIIDKQIPVAYERREDILESPIIKQLLTMARLVHNLSLGNHSAVDPLMAEVLTYEFWSLPLEEVAKISLQCYKERKHWLEVMLESSQPTIKAIANWLLETVRHSHTQPLEYLLDRLIGSPDEHSHSSAPTDTTENFHSPLRQFYFNNQRLEKQTGNYLELLGQLSTLRQQLRSWQPDRRLYLADLITFTDLHARAKIKIVDTNPHTQTTEAVQVMTAYKAKGLEFEVVFVINAQDDVWGARARTLSDLIRLPRNLPIKPTGSSVDDRLRLLFVAMTRAKHSLFITSYTHNLNNKLSSGLSFIGGHAEGSQNIHPSLQPKHHSKVTELRAIELLSTDWLHQFSDLIADKPSLMKPLLDNYKLSATHLNNFLDVTKSGPEYFLVHNLLRFPQSIAPQAAYGDAMHKVMQWLYSVIASGSQPNKDETIALFKDVLQRKHLNNTDEKLFYQRGLNSLQLLLDNKLTSFNPQAIIERNFSSEGVIVAGAHLTGKIDKLEIIKPGAMKVTDFKTGKPAQSWRGRDDYEATKLHKYQQQLMFYKLLVENSGFFGKQYKVDSGALEFLEADEDGQLRPPLELTLNDSPEIERFKLLISAVWQRIMKLDFPDTSKYPKNTSGIKKFEQDLLDSA